MRSLCCCQLALLRRAPPRTCPLSSSTLSGVHVPSLSFSLSASRLPPLLPYGLFLSRRSLANVPFKDIKSKAPLAVAMSVNEYDGYRSATGTSSTPRPYTVFIEGNVGSGKTTFLEQFADCPNVFMAKEPVHKWQDVRGHNFLGLMYEDPKRWSFAFQSIVQRTMLELHQATPELGQNIKIMERSIYSARNIFVENLYKDNLMAAPEYAVLDAWYKWLIGNVKIESDLIIYLRTDPEIAYQRIKTRNRAEEKYVPFEYIKHLHELHDKWLNVHKTDVPKNIPVIIVDANQSMELVKKQFKGIKDIITKNASTLIETKISPSIPEIGLNDIQLNNISPCKLVSDSTIIPAQRV